MLQPEILKRLLLAAVSLLAANPVVLYLLTGSLLASAAASAAVVALVQTAYRPGRSLLILAYTLNFVVLASLFVHAEVVFDARFSDYAPENLYATEDGYYFNLPYLAERFDDKEYTAHYITNAQGIRIGEGQNPDEEIGAADWLFIGDSFTQGAQVEFEDLYTTKLYRRFPDKVIVNAGISGFGIPQELRYYEQQGRLLRPSVVFLQLSSFNDLMNVREREAGFTDRLMERSDFVRYLLADIKYENPPELPLGRWTEPFHPDEDGNRSYNVFYTDDDDVKREDLREFVRYLGLFKEAVEADGARLVVLFLPTKEQTVPRLFEEVIREFDVDPARLDMTRPNRLVSSACDSLGIGLVDLLQPFQRESRPAFFEYDEHLSPFGHDLLARAVGDALRSGAVAGVHVGGDAPEVLSRELVSDRYPIQYATGGLISFQAMLGGNTEILVADSAFGDLQRLTFNDVNETHPMLSPDLSRVVFTEGVAETMETKVVEMRMDGTRRRVLTTQGQTYGAIPAYDATGTRVAYAEWRRTEEGEYTPPHIAVLDLRTGARRAVTRAGEEAWRPVFSSDGHLAYIKRVNGQFDLFLYDPSTGRETRLTETPYDEWDPSFGPTGLRLVYAAKRDGNWDLFSVDTASKEPPLRITQTLGDEWDPSVAPDGRSVLFAGHFGSMKGAYRLPLRPGW